VAADAKSKTYGDTDPALTWSVTSGSLVGSDTLTGALSRATGSNVGSYAIDASALANTNYSITPTNGLFTINARPITVAADDKKKTYGEADPALTWSVIAGSLVGSDSLMGAVTRAPGIRVGTYAIDLSTLSNPNYSITRQDGTLTVVPPVPTPGQTANATVPVSQPMVAWSGNQAPMTTRGGLALSAGNTGSVSLNTVVMGVQTQSQGGLVPELARLPLKAPTADELMQMARR
jgi:hypothetical protein